MRVIAVFQRVSSSVTGRYLRSSFRSGTMAPSLYLSVLVPSIIEFIGLMKCSSTSSGRYMRCSLVIPLGPPHFPGWHLRRAARSSCTVWTLAKMDWKSAVSSGVGSILRLMVFARFGASLIWVRVTVISLCSSWIQLVVCGDRGLCCRVSWLDSSSSIMSLGVSMS